MGVQILSTLDVLAGIPGRDGQLIRMNKIAKFFHDCRNPSCLIQILHSETGTGSDVGQVGNLTGNTIPEVQTQGEAQLSGNCR